MTIFLLSIAYLVIGVAVNVLLSYADTLQHKDLFMNWDMDSGETFLVIVMVVLWPVVFVGFGIYYLVILIRYLVQLPYKIHDEKIENKENMR